MRAPDTCLPLRAEGLGYAANGVAVLRDVTFALETSKGDLPLALALGLVLMAVVLGVNALAQLLQRRAA